MAKEGERSAPVDKGKGKAEDVKDMSAGKKPQKDEKQQANGKKKDEEPQEGRSSISTRGRPSTVPNTARNDADVTTRPEELSEEDQQLKGELEMLVERLKVFFFSSSARFKNDDVDALCSLFLQEPDTSLYIPAVDAIKNFIKTSTSSMTAVPKPLKFLRPHYDELAAVYEKWSPSPVKVRLYMYDIYCSSTETKTGYL